VRCPGCYSCGVIESFIVPFHKTVILVFRDIIYVIDILYSGNLAICEHFVAVCVEQLILGIQTMSTWFWHKNRRNASLVRRVLSLVLFSSICKSILCKSLTFASDIQNLILWLFTPLSFSSLDDEEVDSEEARSCTAM
jgi:hypothetical protein